MKTYEELVNDVKTLEQAMALLGECSSAEITCCFEDNIMYLDIHGVDVNGNSLNIAIHGNAAATATIIEE